MSSMPSSSLFHRFRTTTTVVVVCAAVLTVTHIVRADAAKTAADYAADPAGMLEAYRHVEAASVSDAIEQSLHVKTYMSHRMQSPFIPQNLQAQL